MDTSPHSGAWDGAVVICAANNYDGIRLADQHLADRLAALVPVVYVDPPMSRLTPLRNPHVRPLVKDRLRIQRPGFACVTPVVQPCPARRGLTGMTAALTRRQLRQVTGRLGGHVRAVLSAWPQFPVAGSCAEGIHVYWAQDDFAAGATLFGLNGRHIRRRERRIAAVADLVIAANPLVEQTWRNRGCETSLIPYGADTAAYRNVDDLPLPADVSLPPPVAGFVGHINARTDLRLLEAVAGRGHSLLLVGPLDPGFQPARVAALLERANVSWVGPKPFPALPGYFKVIDVGLVPYTDSAFNRGSFPLKTLEYLAAGRPVVATDLPAIRWLATDLVTVASGPRDFAGQVERLLGPARTPAAMERRRSFAAQHDWAVRAREVHEAILGRCHDSAVPRPGGGADPRSRVH